MLRLAVKSKTVNEHFFNAKDGPQFIQFLFQILSESSNDANKMLVLRALCNSFSQSAGETLLLANRERVMVAVAECCRGSHNKTVEVAASSLLLNYSVGFYKNRDDAAKTQCLSVTAALSEGFTNPEAIFRLLVCLGTLLQNDMNCIELAKSLDLSVFINKSLTMSEPSKVCECAKFVGDILKITT